MLDGCGKARNEKLQLILAYQTPKDASVLENIDMKARKILEITQHHIKAKKNIHVFDDMIGQKNVPMQR